MLTRKFGIEIEFTGITKTQAAKVAAEHLGGRADYSNTVTDRNGRKWKFVYDGSIRCEKKVNRSKVSASREYSVELVSPVLTYREDIETLQELIRKLRKAGGFANNTCGIHIHLNGADHDARSIKNFINIIASKNDLLYKALQIKPQRMTYCKKMDDKLVQNIKRKRPRTLEAIENIWYEGYYESRSSHYHDSRYHFLNLHSFFHGNKTVELRGFNSELHAGKVRAYIVLALALNNQALTQTSASSRKPQTENEKFAMRTYLNRIGLIGDDFKNCRDHLTAHLTGSAAWRYGSRTESVA